MNLTKELVDLAYESSWKNQSKLLQFEDQFIEKREVVLIKNLNDDEKRYLSLGSIPYTIRGSLEEAKENLAKIWTTELMQIHDSVANRPPSLPTGNIHAKYILVGDAPGRGSCPGKYDRTLVYGPSSHVLRKATISAGIHFQCWYTNLSKVSMVENRPTLNKDVLAYKKVLLKEIELIHPNYIILMGNHVREMFYDHYLVFGLTPVYDDIKVLHIPHPSYMSRMNEDPRKYGKLILERIAEV